MTDASPCAFAHGGSTREREEKMKGTGILRGWTLVGAVAVASMLGVRTVQAQYNPIAFGIVAGASIPLGDFGDFVETGWHAGVLAQWNGPAVPIGIRGEVVYHQFGSKDVSDAHLNLLTATLNGVWTFPMTEPATVRPYIIGGGGLYRESCSDCNESSNHGGLNVGAGIQVPLSGFTSIIEARWHIIFDSDSDIEGDSNTTFVPISVGLLFR